MSNIIEKQTNILNKLLNIMVDSIDGDYDSAVCNFEYDHGYKDGSASTGAELSYSINSENRSIGIREMRVVDGLIRELHEVMKSHTGGDWKEFVLSMDENGRAYTKFIYDEVMCAEIIGHFHLGDSTQPTCKSPLLFDLVS